MKTINQTLKASNTPLGHWNLWINQVQGQLASLSIRAPRSVPVEHTHDTGHDITVRVFEDGYLNYCNHAGAEEGTITKDGVFDGRQFEYEVYATLCDKCDGAWDKDGGEL